MSVLWPRLPLSESARLFADINAGHVPSPTVSHAGQTYGHVGSRARPHEVALLHTRMQALVDELGGSSAVGGDRGVEFDRRAAPILHDTMVLTWSEASVREVWSFVALVVLPDLTEARWAHRLPNRNEERWIGRDLMRHTWARLWWQAAAFETRPDLLARLNESELNQLLERRSIGGQPALLVAVSDAFLDAVDAGAPRRSLMRDMTRRLRRRMPYIDDHALSDPDLRAMADALVLESLANLRSGDAV